MKTKWKPVIITVIVAVLVLAVAGVALAVGLQKNGNQEDTTYRGGGYGVVAADDERPSDCENCTDGSCVEGECAGGTCTEEGRDEAIDGRGSGNGGPRDDRPSTEAGTSATALSAEEEQELLYMREEEKLARDVYLALYEKWGVEEFENVAASESRHMESVKRLLDRYGLADPVGADAPGVFADPELQQLYDELLAQGSLSVIDAYNVGVTIEEVDIADLEELIALSTHRDITRVAENLLRGSQRHLEEFNSLLGA